MKKNNLFRTLLTVSILAAVTISEATAQNTTRGTNGNFSAIVSDKTKAAHDSTTTFTYTDKKGKVEKVYKGKRGSFYVVRTSKPSERNNFKGKFYRKYLKD